MEKRRKLIVKTIVGAVLLYVSFLSVLNVLSANISFTKSFYDATKNELVPMPDWVIQAGYYLPVLLCLLLVLALHFLGCVKARSLFIVLPTFALSVVWLLYTNTTLFGSHAQIHNRIFSTGGALALAFTGFSALYSLFRWIKYKENPLFI